MKKKAASRKASGTRKKKETARKVRTAAGTSEKTEQKKKGKIVPKGEKEKKIKKVTGKEKQEPVRKKISAKLGKSKKAEARGKSEKKITKTQVHEKEKAGKVSHTARTVRKTGEKAEAKGRVKRVSPKAAGKVGIKKKLVEKTTEKIEAGAVTKTGVSEKEKISGRIVSGKVVSSEVKEVAGGKEIGKSEKWARPLRIIKGVAKSEEFGDTVETSQSKVAGLAEKKESAGAQKAEAEKEVGEEVPCPPSPWAVLPEEYGENSVTLMTVAPHRLFAFWEVREQTLQIFRGDVDIRVYDVTDIDFNMMDANSCFDIRADERVGKCYITVNPEREYIADVGIIFDGIFIAIARSARVSTPRATVSKEGILSYGLGETGPRTGY